MHTKFILKFFLASLYTELQNAEPVFESSRVSTPQKYPPAWWCFLVLVYYSLTQNKGPLAGPGVFSVLVT